MAWTTAAVAVMAASNKERSPQESADPVAVGLKEFGNNARSQREEVANFLIATVRHGYNTLPDTLAELDDYIEATAEGIVLTTASTGLTVVSSPLLYRASEAFLKHEEYTIGDIASNRGYYFDREKFTKSYSFKQKRKLNQALGAVEEDSSGIQLAPIMPKWNYGAFFGEEFADLADVTKPSQSDVLAFTVAKAGIDAHIRTGVLRDFNKLVKAYTRLATVLPDFRDWLATTYS